MKKIFSIIVSLIVFLFLISPVQAIQLLTEDFTGATIHNNLTINLKNNPPSGADDNLGKWLDFPSSLRWGISGNGQGGAADSYAKHLTQTSDNTNLLYYGIDLSGYLQLATFALDFDYIASNRKPTVVLAGMLNGQHALDPFAPWFSPGDLDDGETILQQKMNTTNSWTSVHIEGSVSKDYDVLALGFIMGGTTGNRGIDNISLSAKSIPEPGIVLMIGIGFAGMLGFRKKLKS